MAEAPGETTFLVIGEALVDVVVSGGGTLREHPGGGPANIAFGLGRLGDHVTLLTQLAADTRGEAVRAHLESAGVSVLATASDGTSTATATIDADGSASYDFDVTWDVDTSLAPVADVLHVGSIGALLAPGADEVLFLVTARRADSLISFDPNIRPVLLGPRPTVVTRVEHLVVLSDIVKASAEDLVWLYPHATPVVSAMRWATIGGPLVVLTNGADGVTGFWHGARIDIAPDPVAVVDTIGAGDAFMAALLDAVGREERGLDREGFLDLSEQVIARALRWAVAAAAITVSRAGADLPWRDEVLGRFHG